MAPRADMQCSVPLLAGLAGRQQGASLWAAQQRNSCNCRCRLVRMLLCLIGWPAGCQSKAHDVHSQLLGEACVRNPLQPRL